MRNLNQDKDRKQEKLPRDKEVKDDLESKPSRLAERKGQRPAFPFRRKPVYTRLCLFRVSIASSELFSPLNIKK